MNALNLTAQQSLPRRRLPDLDGAYNDGFEPSPREPLGVVLGRWTVLTWSVAAWGVGSIIMVRAILIGLALVGNELWRTFA